MSAFAELALKAQTTGAWRWYMSREPQERPIIAGVAVLVVASLVWLAVWKPISDWRDLEANRYQNAQETLDWMRANEALARTRARQASAPQTAERSLLPVVTRLANAQGLRLNRLQPESDGAVSVVVQGQPFNSVVQWLAALAEGHNVTVQRISVDAEGQPGLVNAQIRLF